MKSVKNLIVPFIILIALIIGVVIYYVATNIKNSQETETSQGYIDVVFFNYTDVASVSVYNSETQFTSLVKCSFGADDSMTFDYQGDDAVEGQKYSQSKLYEYISYLVSFTCNAKVSSAGNYADYGLDNPRYTISITTISGDVTTIYLGNKSPDGQFCYMYVAGSADIYTINVFKYDLAAKTGIDFLDSTALSIDYSDLATVHFDRKTDGLSLDANVILNDKGVASFEFYKPYTHSSSGYFCTMIDSIVDLEITEYVAIAPDELSKYGLEEPTYHFVLTSNSGSKTELFFSRELSGYYYGYVAGMDNYFMISTYQIDNLDLAETVLIDPYVCYCYAKDISTINCTYGDKSFKFTLYVPDGESITSDKSSVELDGRNAKISDSTGRSFCSILFESIACIKIAGSEPDAVVDTSAGPVITLEFVDNAYTSTVYEFYTRDADSFYVFKNGEFTSFYVYSSEIFYNGGLDTYSYGFWSAYELLSEAITNNANGIYEIPTEN